MTYAVKVFVPPYAESAELIKNRQLDATLQSSGLGVAFMLESHLKEAHDDRLVQLFDVKVESPYSYWFACRRSALARRPVLWSLSAPPTEVGGTP